MPACKTCEGKGQVRVMVEAGDGVDFLRYEDVPCVACRGKGAVSPTGEADALVAELMTALRAANARIAELERKVADLLPKPPEYGEPKEWTTDEAGQAWLQGAPDGSGSASATSGTP